MPRASATPPVAITGTRTASATCGTRVNVPTCDSTAVARNMPRCPPASAPWAITASQPRASSQRASSTVVAEETTLAPAARTRASSAASGRPKWKLTTSGLSDSTTAQVASSNGARLANGAVVSGSMPNSA